MFLVETGESRTIPETRAGGACSYFLEWNQANQPIEHVVGPWTLTFKKPLFLATYQHFIWTEADLRKSSPERCALFSIRAPTARRVIGVGEFPLKMKGSELWSLSFCWNRFAGIDDR